MRYVYRSYTVWFKEKSTERNSSYKCRTASDLKYIYSFNYSINETTSRYYTERDALLKDCMEYIQLELGIGKKHEEKLMFFGQYAVLMSKHC